MKATSINTPETFYGDSTIFLGRVGVYLCTEISTYTTTCLLNDRSTGKFNKRIEIEAKIVKVNGQLFTIT